MSIKTFSIGPQKATEIAAQWQRKAEENFDKWDDPGVEALALAIAEESGEIARAVLDFIHSGKPKARITEETHDLAALCFQMLDSLGYTQ